MPRNRRGSTDRGSRTYSKLSAVTIVTNPSGVTIDKANLIATTNGYLLQHDTANEMIKMGYLDFNGASKTVAPSDLGLTTLKHLAATLVVSGATALSAASMIFGYRVNTVPSGDLTGVTQVHFFAYAGNGGAFGGGASIAYFAVGT